VQEIYHKAQIDAGEVPDKIKYHPHYKDSDFREQKHNFIFTSDEANSGIFPFSEPSILSATTQKNYKKSFWKALPFLKPQSNRIKKVKPGIWNSGGRGQEFVCKVKDSKAFEQWFSQLNN
jgi:hypothetical protein